MNATTCYQVGDEGGNDGDDEGDGHDEGDDEDEDDLEPPVHSVVAVNQCRQPRASWQFDV